MTTQPQTLHHLFTFYLSPAHIDQPRTVTIDSAEIRQIYNDKAGKELPGMVIHFREARRSLKVNKTQAEAIWTITGTDDHTKWTGARVTLTKVPTKRGGKSTIEITKAQ